MKTFNMTHENTERFRFKICINSVIFTMSHESGNIFDEIDIIRGNKQFERE